MSLLDLCRLLVNPVEGSRNLCTGEYEYGAGYNYNVTLWVSALFAALFGLLSIAHLIQGMRGRKWFMLGTVTICAIAECLGWAGRTWSAVSTEWRQQLGGYWTSDGTAFLMQIAVLIFAPAFLAAGWYIMLGQLIGLLGPQYCRFNRVTYAVCFVIGDVCSLVVQAIGGGMAAAADTRAGADRGAKIMVAGVIIQMVVMILYSILLAETVTRFVSKRPVKPFRFRKTRDMVPVPDGSVSPEAIRKAKILIGAMVFSTVLIFIRSIYRTIELLEGWTGPIISNEMLFCVLDGLMVFLAVLVLNIFHPAQLLPARPKNAATPSHAQVDVEKASLAHSGEQVMSHQSSRTLGHTARSSQMTGSPASTSRSSVMCSIVLCRRVHPVVV